MSLENTQESTVDGVAETTTPVGSSSEETTTDETDYKAEYERLKALDESNQSMIGKQAQELGDLRKKLGEPLEEQTTTTEEKVTKETVTEKLETKGLDYSEFQQDYYNNGGKLSEEMNKKALDAGYTQEQIDNNIAGLQATAQKEYEQVSEAVDGVENLNTIFQWAAKNLSESELNDLKAELASEPTLKASQLIIKDLQTKMLAKEGTPPTYLQGNGASTAGDVFKSQAQGQKALRDPRADYKSPEYDPAYVDEVYAKIDRSIAAGTYRKQ